METTADLYGARLERVDHLKFEHYHAAPGVGKPLLDELALSPAHAYEAITGAAEPDAVELLIENVVESFFSGQPFHGCWIRPETYPDKDGTRKPWNGHANWCRDWLKAHQDKPVLTMTAHSECQAMARATFMHRHFRAITSSRGVSQVSLFGVHPATGLQLKARLDRLEPRHGIIEILRTANASTESVRRTLVTLRCHVQAALRLELCRQNGIAAPACWLVFVERGERPRVNVRRLDDRAIELGRQLLEAGLTCLHECIQNDSWPDHSGATPLPGPIDLPATEYSSPNASLAARDFSTGGPIPAFA
jgi:hypothetical protein